MVSRTLLPDSSTFLCTAEPSLPSHCHPSHPILPPDALASIMNDLFGGVVYAGIDTDRYKYPIGE